jgi:hypothetical protein
VIPVDDSDIDGDSVGDATVKGNVRSHGGEMMVRLQHAIQSGRAFAPAGSVAGNRLQRVPAIRSDDDDNGRNTQVNDATLDHVTTFDPSVVVTRPFEFATQSETSLVRRGNNIVVGYNSSAGAVVEFIPGFGLAFTQIHFSGFSTSHDGGRTWASGFVPAVPGSPFTLGDPSLAMDRRGHIFYTSLGTDAAGNSGLIINESTDGGTSFGDATVVVLDPGSDKEWLAIGPDPTNMARDNLYVTWTSFGSAGSTLNLARSIDGGATWTTQTLFAPVDDGTNSSFIQFSNPAVDASSGRLYVPFLHFSDLDADNIRLFVSDDGGQSFSLVAFNIAGAPDAFALPAVAPGVINDCGSGGFRNSLHQGPSAGPGRNIGVPTFRYTQSTRLITQPSLAVTRGRVILGFNSSTSSTFDDPTAGSQINVIGSTNGGKSWSPIVVVAPSTESAPNHVHPSVAISGDDDGGSAFVAFYTQQANEQLRTDIAQLHLGGDGLRAGRTTPLSTTSFDLTPSNIPFPPGNTAFATTNFDRTIAHCYDIGEYMSVKSSEEGAVAAWGDNRNTWTGPAGSSAPFTHAQPDVFFSKIGD